MFAQMLDNFREAVERALGLTSLAAATAFALFITIVFLCAAAFVYVLQHYGLIEACLTGAAIFFVVTLIAAACYMARKRRAEARAAEAKTVLQTALADPTLLAAGIQVIRAIGVKRLVPILAVGGLALGFLASRSPSRDEDPAE